MGNYLIPSYEEERCDICGFVVHEDCSELSRCNYCNQDSCEDCQKFLFDDTNYEGFYCLDCVERQDQIKKELFD